MINEYLLLEHKKQEILDRYAMENCPYKIGDIVPVVGYSYRGKTARVEGIKVTFCNWGDPHFEWRVYARVLKKDGTPGEQIADWEEHHCK